MRDSLPTSLRVVLLPLGIVVWCLMFVVLAVAGLFKRS